MDVISKEKVCIIGLGYVGLTLSLALAKKGVDVVGIEKDKNITLSLDKNEAHFHEKGINEVLLETKQNGKFSYLNEIKEKNSFTTFIITVGTPLDKNNKPNMKSITAASKEIADKMNNNSLIILRSTVAIGTTNNVVKKELQKTKKDFEIAMCPERTIEGKALKELCELPQVIGADEKETLNRCESLFKTITPKTVPVSSVETAEIIKLTDNTYRDLNFAFSNEILMISKKYNVDGFEVAKKASEGYSRNNIKTPGPVGGPCLEKDPLILAHSAGKKSFNAILSSGSREINNIFLRECCDELLQKLTNKLNGRLKILFCGLAFKGIPETDDLRGSTGIKFIEIFKSTRLKKNDEIAAFDPIVSSKKIVENKLKLLSESEHKNYFDAAIILNNHKYFNEQGMQNLRNFLKDDGFIYDLWNQNNNLKDTAWYFYPSKKI